MCDLVLSLNYVFVTAIATGISCNHFAVAAQHADMLHDFMSSVQSAQSKLAALCTCVEDYVEKLTFLDQYLLGEKAMDAACQQVCEDCSWGCGRLWYGVCLRTSGSRVATDTQRHGLGVDRSATSACHE